MPKIIDSSFQSQTIGQIFSFKADSDFIQQGMYEIQSEIIESLIGKYYDSTKSYILKGCELSISGGNTVISEGYIYGINKAFGGLPNAAYIYYHAGSTFVTPTGSNVVVGNIVSVPSAFDPTPFSNQTTQNVHNIITISFSSGLAGSKDLNYSDLLFYDKYIDGGNLTTIPAITGTTANVYNLLQNKYKIVKNTFYWNIYAVISGNSTSFIIQYPKSIVPVISSNFDDGIYIAKNIFISDGASGSPSISSKIVSVEENGIGITGDFSTNTAIEFDINFEIN